MENVEDILPLTPVQEGMLFHSLESSDDGIYLEQAIVSLHGELDKHSLIRALSELVQRHDALRSSILWEELERPVRVIHSAMDAEIIEPQTSADAASALEQFLVEDRKKSFDLRRGPLVRYALIAIGQQDWRLVISFHHIIADGWSMLLLLRELGRTYGAHVSGEVLQLPRPPPFSAYIDWLEQQSQTAAETFWLDYLRGFNTATRFAVAPAGIASRDSDARLERRVPIAAATVSQLEKTARQHRVTVNTLVQMAWALVLSRYSGDTDVVFGSTLAGRPPELNGVENTVGLFIQSAPTRVTLDNELPVAAALAQLQSRQLSVAEHAHSGLARIHKWCEVPAGEDLFESLLVFESMPSEDAQEFGELDLEALEFRERSNYPLAVLILPGPQWQLLVIADGQRFAPALIERLCSNILHALNVMGTIEPSTLIGELDVLSNADLECQARYGQGAPNEPPVSTWLELLENTVARQGQEPALCQGQQSWNYRELYAEIARRATGLLDAGVCTGDRVGIEAHRNANTIISLLAIIRAGAVYVPLEVAQPPQRLKRIAAAAGLKWIISDSASDSMDLPVIDSTTWAGIDLQAAQPAFTPPRPEQPVYIIHTSGSTGTPRGVEICHGALLHSTWARVLYYSQAPQNFLLLSSPGFDSSVAGIFWTLGTGGTLILPEEQRAEELEHLLDTVESRAVSHLLCVPSLWQLMLQADAGRLTNLKLAIVAGEACPVALARDHRSALPDTLLYNEYGPTEATVWCTVQAVCDPQASRTVPIGIPIAGVQLRIADNRGRHVPTGVAGELLISGPTLANSYVNCPQETAQAFCCDLPCSGGERVYRTGDQARWCQDGTLEYLGREDGQIKINGRRIETGEIEAALERHSRIRESAVVLTAVEPGSPSIDDLAAALAAIEPAEAEAMLSMAEQLAAAQTYRQSGDGYALELVLQPGLIEPPREEQRRWIISQLLREFGREVEHLDAAAAQFVRGADTFLGATDDVSNLDLQDDDIMEDWQRPILIAMADAVTAGHGKVLEIGFGRGISASMIQDQGVASHTIIEANEHCIERYFEPWRARYSQQDIRIVQGTWQHAISALGEFDGIFFHTAARNLQELAEATVDQVTYAEHFFATAAEHLRPGGVFTYLSNEADSLGRTHQRRLLQLFSSFSVRRIDHLQIPEDTRDVWWAPSMVVVSAVK